MKKGITTLMLVVFMMAEFSLSQTSWSDHEYRTTVSLKWDSPGHLSLMAKEFNDRQQIRPCSLPG